MEFLTDREGRAIARFEPTADMGEVRPAMEAAREYIPLDRGI